MSHNPYHEPRRLLVGVKASVGLKSALGGCNGCDDPVYRLDAEGRPLVTEVQLYGSSFRLCAKCSSELKQQLV